MLLLEKNDNIVWNLFYFNCFLSLFLLFTRTLLFFTNLEAFSDVTERIETIMSVDLYFFISNLLFKRLIQLFLHLFWTTFSDFHQNDRRVSRLFGNKAVPGALSTKWVLETQNTLTLNYLSYNISLNTRNTTLLSLNRTRKFYVLKSSI